MANSALLERALKAQRSKREQILHEKETEIAEKNFYSDRKLKLTPENSLALITSASVTLDLLIQSADSAFQHRKFEIALDCIRAVQKRIYEKSFK